MDRLVNHLFVFEGEGQIRDYPGNYSLYREWQKTQQNEVVVDKKEVKKVEPVEEQSKKKLSFKEQREFEMLEKEIAQFEKERSEINEQLSSSNLPYNEIQKLTTRIGELNQAISAKEMRWLELSE
jgi:ATP-binding cassette subfamily F protein uup